MKRPIGMKKEGIQTRNRKITSRCRKKKCHTASDDQNRTFTNKECVPYNSVQQCVPATPYSDHHENLGNLYNLQTASTANNYNYNSFSNLQQPGYGFHSYQQTMVGPVS